MAKQGDTDRPAFTETLRAIDDSELDVYEFRLMVHVWRVGVSWESMRTMAKKCGMSLGKIQQAQKSLIEKGHLVHESRGGRMGLTVSVRSSSEQVQQESSSKRSPHEQTQQVISSNRSPHEQNVHDMNAILNQPLKSTNNNNDRPPLQILRDHFSQRTTIQPNEQTGMYERNWEKPLAAILEKARGDPLAAVALIDAALDVAWGKNDSGRTYPVASPKSIATIAANLAVSSKATAASDSETIWRRAIDAIARGTFDDERLRAAIRAVGAEKIQTATERTAEGLKGRLAHEYHRIAVPA